MSSPPAPLEGFTDALAPLEVGGTPVRWNPLVHWAVRFADSLDLDAVERSYKLEIAERVQAAADAVRGDDAQWPRLLRRAFSAPNNLTAWRMHETFLDWVDDMSTLTGRCCSPYGTPTATFTRLSTRFCALLASVVSGGGTQANLASFLLQRAMAAVLVESARHTRPARARDADGGESAFGRAFRDGPSRSIVQ